MEPRKRVVRLLRLPSSGLFDTGEFGLALAPLALLVVNLLVVANGATGESIIVPAIAFGTILLFFLTFSVFETGTTRPWHQPPAGRILLRHSTHIPSWP